MPYSGTDEFAELMKYTPLDIAMAASVFFYHLGNELLKSTLTYLEENPAVQNILNKRSSENDRDGIPQFTHLLKEMSVDLMKYPSFRLTSA